ncbi:unnamed protein product [Microthlaspi erraticum]|uniref:Uncharacterized protein n=1 Tax=Microthlaspi erraticum TaxID=1685480 RepID=A0A6D2K215_9BRAS|nr:unnamed protein product [Microthlaspi erraticum]
MRQSKPNIVPSASMFALVAFSMMMFLTVYEKILVPLLRRATGNERGIAFYLSVLGAASFANNLLITVGDRLAEAISGKTLTAAAWAVFIG